MTTFEANLICDEMLELELEFRRSSVLDWGCEWDEEPGVPEFRNSGLDTGHNWLQLTKYDQTTHQGFTHHFESWFIQNGQELTDLWSKQSMQGLQHIAMWFMVRVVTNH